MRRDLPSTGGCKYILYVKSRVNELNNIYEWRDLKAKQLIENSVWKKAPALLEKNQEYWPIQPKLKSSTNLVTAESGVKMIKPATEPILNFKKFSRLKRLAFAFRFVNKCKVKLIQKRAKMIIVDNIKEIVYSKIKKVENF